jgi:hypothetical protein
MTGDDSEIPPELIEEALRTPEPDRLPDEDATLPVTRPAITDIFCAEGLATLASALAHPTLGPLLEALPDRLHWSKDKPEEIGAEGIELFLIAHAFALAGHPIHSMPPIRELAARIHTRGKDRRGPMMVALWRRCRGIYGHYFNQLIIAETLHGTDVLNSNFEPIKALILKAKRKYVPGNVDETDLDDFFRRVTHRAVTAAMRFDPRKSVKFSTYVFKHIDGAARDWRAEYFGIDLKTGERFAGRAHNVDIDPPIGEDEDGHPITIGDTIADPGSAKVPELERPSFAEVANSPDLTAKEKGHLIGLAGHRGSAASYARLSGIEPNALRQLIHRVRNKFR